jgi:hypothetical protein
MRVCDKCGTTVMYTTFHDRRNEEEYDLCKPCYDIFRAWAYDGNTKIKNDPIDKSAENCIETDKPKNRRK